MNQITPSQLNRRIALQRLGMLWERLWTALQWPLVASGIGLALIVSGSLQNLPVWPRIAVLVGLAVAIAISLKGLSQMAWPTRRAAMRRMEQASAVHHRAVSSKDDRIVAETLDPLSDAVWEEHQRRQMLALSGVKVSQPRSAWAQFDPVALRVPVLLTVLAAFALGPGTLIDNLREATRLAPPVAKTPLSLDAWVKPPAYTGKPPLLLSAPSMQEKLARGEELLVPEQSLFTLRVAGASEPSLAVLDSSDAPLAGADVASLKTSQPSEGTFAAEFKLDRPVTLVVSDGGTELARYPIAVVPDAAPTIEISKAPIAEAGGRLVTEWLAKDDIGLKSVRGDIELADEQDGGVGFESNGVFLYDAPQAKFSLRRPNAKEEAGKTTLDLASHPWAGLRVALSLTTKDGAGQEGRSAAMTFTLPERIFIKPMPQALIEQRKHLILFPEKAGDVGEALDTLMLYPEGLVERSGHVVAIAGLASRLRNATGYDDVKSVVAGLWEVAVAIEEGSLEDARAELAALKKELEKALQDGASPERIAELMDKMRKAMDKFMEAMRQEAEKRMKDGTLPRPQPGQEGKVVTQEDLQKMMDALEDLAKGGSREMAERLLNELDRMLQNMQPGQSQQSEGDNGMGEMMDQLGEMMQRQQGLMDETQRQPGSEGENGEQGEQGQEGQDGEQGNQAGKGMGGLADRQRNLQQMLEGMLGQGKGLGQMPDELGQADEAMRGAEQSLRGGDREGALRQQGEALDNLRKGAGKMAEQMRENGQGQAESDARDGEGRGGKDDPLGRPRSTRNPDDGPDDNILPTEQAMKRAREILETLRAKSNEQGLTDSERGYVERLLRGLY